jgi:hypothetical protein
MATELTAVEKAANAAQEALQAAENARDGAEAEFLSSVTRVSQLSQGRTNAEATRLKSRLVSLRGYAAWAKICADSR